jgi:hypothetical protein
MTPRNGSLDCFPLPPLSSSAEDHAPELVLSKTAVDSPKQVVAGKDEPDNHDFGQHDVLIDPRPRLKEASPNAAVSR